MEIIEAKVRHNKAYANPPTMEILVDRLCKREDFIYKAKTIEGRTFYFAEKDGEVDFFVHVPKNETGYGGSVFTVTLDTGETVSIKGPWSSRPSIVGPIFDSPCVDASLTDKKEAFDRGYTFMAGNITLEKAQEIVIPGYSLVLKDKYGEPTWELEEDNA